MTTVVAFVPDLMDRSRIESAVEGVEFVPSADALTSHPAGTVVVDLGRSGVLEALPSLKGRRVIGFASHVDGTLMAAAAAAGCSEVLTRSRFFAGVASVIAGRLDGAEG